MKPNNIGKDMWLQDQFEIQKLKQKLWTQVFYDMQALSVLYRTQ